MSILGGASSAASLVSQVPAYIAVKPPGVGMVRFSYNPDELPLSYSSPWMASPQPADPNGGPPQFQGANAGSITIKILFDLFSMPPSPPAESIKILRTAMQPTEASIAMNDPKPPYVTFGWGTNIIMDQAYITQMSVNYKRFLRGSVIRAEVDVTLTEVPLDVPGTNPTSGGIAMRRSHTMVEGDTLASVAQKEYGKPSRWRALAAANGIDDPMRVRPGTVLMVPDSTEADALA